MPDRPTQNDDRDNHRLWMFVLFIVILLLAGVVAYNLMGPRGVDTVRPPTAGQTAPAAPPRTEAPAAPATPQAPAPATKP